MYKIAEEEMVLCPYNRSHVVSKLRIQNHIIKCKRNNPGIKLATCFYNYTHMLKPEDMLEHYETCPNKARVEEARYYETDMYSGKYLERNNHEDFRGASVLKPTSTINQSQKILQESFDSDNQLSDSSESDTVPGSDVRDEDFWFDDTSSEELEPLPLPKTTSKAFDFIKQDPVPSFDVSTTMEYGKRENNSFQKDAKSQHTIDSLLSDTETDNNDELKEKKNLTVDHKLVSDLDGCSSYESDFNMKILKDFKRNVDIQ